MNKESKKYINDIKKELPYYKRKEKEYIRLLISNIEEFEERYHIINYDDLVTEFGQPKDIAEEYIDSIDRKELIKQLKYRNILKISLIIIIVIFSLVELWKGFLIYDDYEKTTQQRGEYVEISEPEEIPISDVK